MECAHEETTAGIHHVECWTIGRDLNIHLLCQGGHAGHSPQVLEISDFSI